MTMNNDFNLSKRLEYTIYRALKLVFTPNGTFKQTIHKQSNISYFSLIESYILRKDLKLS